MLLIGTVYHLLPAKPDIGNFHFPSQLAEACIILCALPFRFFCVVLLEEFFTATLNSILYFRRIHDVGMDLTLLSVIGGWLAMNSKRVGMSFAYFLSNERLDQFQVIFIGKFLRQGKLKFFVGAPIDAGELISCIPVVKLVFTYDEGGDLDGAITISGGNFYAVTRSTVTAMETDRTIHMTGGTFYVGEIKGTDANITITLKGPYTGTRLSVRGLGNLRIESYLGTSVTWIGRTDGGTVEFLNPTNRTTASLGISDGIIRVAGLGKPSALGSGSKVTMGQTAYSTIGRLFYNGTTNAVCDRELVFSAFTNSTMSYVNLATSGGRVRNETPGTCVTLTGPISLSMPDMSRYPAATAYIWIEGPGDGVVTSDIAGRARLSHEQGGTWSYKGNYTATGIISVNSNCRFELDGAVSAEKDSTLNNKLQVNSGGTLAGTGTIHGASAVYSGGTLAAGSTNRCGTLTFGANPLTLSNGSKLLFKVGAETNDRVVVGGDIVMSGAATTTVTLVPFGCEAIPAGSYTLMTWNATPGGKFVLADGAPEERRELLGVRVHLHAGRARRHLPRPREERGQRQLPDRLPGRRRHGRQAPGHVRVGRVRLLL